MQPGSLKLPAVVPRPPHRATFTVVSRSRSTKYDREYLLLYRYDYRARALYPPLEIGRALTKTMAASRKWVVTVGLSVAKNSNYFFFKFWFCYGVQLISLTSLKIDEKKRAACTSCSRVVLSIACRCSPSISRSNRRCFNGFVLVPPTTTTQSKEIIPEHRFDQQSNSPSDQHNCHCLLPLPQLGRTRIH